MYFIEYFDNVFSSLGLYTFTTVYLQEIIIMVKTLVNLRAQPYFAANPGQSITGMNR